MALGSPTSCRCSPSAAGRSAHAAARAPLAAPRAARRCTPPLLRCPPPAALPRLDQLLPWLNQAGGGSRRTNPFQAERDELLALLLGPDQPQLQNGGSSSSAAQQQRASQLVDALLASQQPFDESLLGGGPWVVVYTKGSLQLWKATWQTGKALSGNGGNEASQAFDPSDRSALNKAEYWGGAVFVTAGGSYTPLGDGASTPQPVRADIASGSLHLFGLDVPLPIRGSGRFEVAYLDRDLRVFRSGGAISVQVRKDFLQQRRAAAAGKR